MNQSRRTIAIAVSTLVGASALLLGGCNGNSQLAQFRKHPTTQMESLGLRQTDIDNRTTITFDTNKRAMYDDLRRAFFTDRPTRLTEQPPMY